MPFTLFRVTEEPFKIPYYATLIRILHDRTDEPIGTPPIGRLLLEDFWRGFQAYLDKLAWRETRLCVRLLSFRIAELITAFFPDPILFSPYHGQTCVPGIHDCTSTIVHRRAG